MSDIMLLGVLRQPLPDDPSQLDPITWAQIRDRMLEAADRIESDQAIIAELADAPNQWLAICNAIIAAMPPGTWEAHHAAEHECGSALPVAVAEMAGHIADLEALLAEEMNRTASMRVEWGAEVAALTKWRDTAAMLADPLVQAPPFDSMEEAQMAAAKQLLPRKINSGIEGLHAIAPVWASARKLPGEPT